ncbi:HAD hydrolase-like protein [Buchananella felis]|uniref:HAD-IIA family hydrolase n=1 Tax=Buchananella felis TaxID=3231492 RepID=UPI003526CB63
MSGAPEYRPGVLLGCQVPLSEAYQVALLDLDGVCYAGKLPIDFAAEGINAARAAGMASMFVTNNASRLPADVAAHLTELGIQTTAEQVMTAAQDVAEVMRAELEAGATVFVLGTQALVQAVEDAGFTVVSSADDAPTAVVQGLDRNITWASMSEAVLCISRGARFYASNLDSTLPTERGMAIGNGSLVACVEHAAGVKATPAGKPLAGIFHRALARAGGGSALGVGDRLNTDVACAVTAQVPSLHVLTGVSDARAVALAAPAERPSFLAKDLRGLSEPHPEVAVDGTSATCRQSTARFDADGTLYVGEVPLAEGAVVGIDHYRAVVAAAWAAADQGVMVSVPAFTVA